MTTVGAILRYPVKSMLGVGVERAELVDSGLVGDRGWALVDTGTGKVASAKQPRWWRALLTLHAAGQETGPVQVRMPDGALLEAGSPAADQALSTLLGRPVVMRQVRDTGAELDRAVPEAVLADGVEADVPFELLELALEAPGRTFVDYAPVHLITSATLAAIRSAGAGEGHRHDADPRRFRANLVLDAPELSGFAENDWVGRELTVGGTVRLQVFLPTPRCAVPTLEHGDLGRDPHVLRTLARHNRIEVEGFGLQQSAGVYAKVLVPGTVQVGDPVTLVA
jgi:uncharacterized protein